MGLSGLGEYESGVSLFWKRSDQRSEYPGRPFRLHAGEVARSGFPMLVLHDTTEFSYQREDAVAIGIIKKLTVGYNRPVMFFTTCGI